ncbi:MAG TPA: MBL fold metallo-hydrolase [Actinomycetota bacterium]|jgi:beta-lactamase superfamily II metal-dependent hydrolase
MGLANQVPAGKLLTGQDFLREVRGRPDALVYFLCNVGDGDAQVVLLPATAQGAPRQVVVVDAARTGKVPGLLRALEAAGVVSLQPGGEDPIALVVATHPHQDHIGGMVELLERFGELVAEFWDPGYFHAIPAYFRMMAAIEARPNIVYAQPTSGLRRWIGEVAVSVLAPSVQLRNRFDSYGTEINDASISLRLEFPVSRFVAARQDVEEGNPAAAGRSASLILGGDAQSLSWAYAVADFPFLRRSDTPAARAIAAAQANVDLLKSQVLKVSHHGSKHGVNLELVERIGPKVTLVSSVGGGGEFHFPHTVTQELVREALDPTTDSPRPHPSDFELGIFYTADTDPQGPLGSIALVLSPTTCTMWRFGDLPGSAIDLTRARKWADRL